jgi:hypothetical protein
MYLGERWTLLPEVAGMFGILSTTTLDHYSVFRIELQRRFERARLILDIERGLTPESDDVAGGLRFEIDWHRRSDHETEACRP